MLTLAILMISSIEGCFVVYEPCRLVEAGERQSWTTRELARLMHVAGKERTLFNVAAAAGR